MCYICLTSGPGPLARRRRVGNAARAAGVGKRVGRALETVGQICAMANKVTNPGNKHVCSTSFFAGLCFDISVEITYMSRNALSPNALLCALLTQTRALKLIMLLRFKLTLSSVFYDFWATSPEQSHTLTKKSRKPADTFSERCEHTFEGDDTLSWGMRNTNS